MGEIKDIFNVRGITIDNLQEEQFEKYYNYLIEENQKYNLTAIIDKNEVINKHFIDSVLPFLEMEKNAKVIDVGTGAGFPGVPLKILRPDIRLTLVDSLQKRIIFLQNLLKLLEINNVQLFHCRVEDYAMKNREIYDIAVSRAVASLPSLSEYLLPLIKINGKTLIYKSLKAEEELAEAKKAIKVLGGTLEKIIDYSNAESVRKVIIIKKINSTPSKYPRAKNLPRLKPIK